MEKIIIKYYLFINALTFLISGIDKIKAKRNKWRIKEIYLHTLSLFGGALGMFFSMILFRHKINKIQFVMITSFALALHIFIVWYLFILK